MLAELAGKLMALRRTENTAQSANVIFGSVNTLAANLEQKTPVRIAMFPAISQTDPHLAMGLMTCLAYLLENYRDITVYRQFVRLDENAADPFTWTIDRSQFTFDDWQLEALDDNATVWGELQRTPQGVTLRLMSESDLLDETVDVFEQQYNGMTIAELIERLPRAAKDIAVYLNAVDMNRVRLLEPYSRISTFDDAYLSELLGQVFEFEVHLLLHLWSQEYGLFAQWMTIQADIQDESFSHWLINAVLCRLLLPGMGLRDQLPDDETLTAFFEQSPAALANIARSISVSDWQSAVQLLENAVEAEDSEHMQSEQADLFFTLADLYLQAGQLALAAEHYQNSAGLASDSATAQFRVAQILALIDENNSTTGRERVYTNESLEAYERALELGVSNKAQVLMAQLLLLLHSDEQVAGEAIITKFEQLVSEDKAGEFVTDAVEELYNIDLVDFDQVLDVLEKAASDEPDRIDRQINLASAYLLDDGLDNAADVLEKALDMATNPDQIAEIQRLMLYADDPDFESIIGEIIDKIGTKTPLDETEIDYLEQVIEAAPKYPEGYLLLVQGYQLWNDPNAAMETLLDAVRELPNDAEILVMLAQALISSDQIDVVISYLQRSAEHNPLHIPTLALLGRALFDGDQHEEARAVMSRAEMLAPRHPALAEIRAYIAKRMAE
jgi:tetratricopeptide (TPR) repeat protein